MWDSKFATDGFSGKDSLFSKELGKKLRAQQAEVDAAFAILDEYLDEGARDPSAPAAPAVKITSGD